MKSLSIQRQPQACPWKHGGKWDGNGDVLWDVRTHRSCRLLSSGWSRGFNWYLFTDVSGPTGCTEMPVNNYLSVLTLVTAYAFQGTKFIPKISKEETIREYLHVTGGQY